jgi:flagellar basal-body rod modification protein FlgD
MSTVPNNPTVNGVAAAAPQKRTPNKELGQAQFFELMLTQLKNQDPLKPLQNGEFLAQLAQFSTVQGIQKLQESFGQFTAGMQSAQALQASSLVGRSVLLPGTSAALAQGGNLSGAVELAAGASSVAVEIYDAGGQLVQRLDLGAQPAGLAKFSWDGTTASGTTAAPGQYTVKAVAGDGGQSASVPTLIAAKVESVTLGGPQGLQLNLAGLGPVSLNDVKQIM